MARVQSVSLTGNGSTVQNSEPIPLNIHITPFNVGLGLSTSGSTTTATVQVTFDDPSDLSSATWFDHSLLAAITAKSTGNIAFPVTAVRFQIGATGTDVWTFWVVQAGIR